MDHATDTAGKVFPNRQAFEEHRRQRDKILNPPKPRPKIEAVKIKSGGRLFAGKRREAGDILLVMPDQLPPGFVSKDEARDLVENGHATPATPEEIEQFIEAQQPTTNPADQ
jgi:hypothetical protein